MKNQSKLSLRDNEYIRAWKKDAKDFEAWFENQKYSFGAIPTFTQIEEMKRCWCIARETLREEKGIKI